MVTARMAQTLLDAATPGPWRMELHRERDAIHIDAPRGDARIGHDSWYGLAIAYGCEDHRRAGDAVAHANASLICAAHDLARTVVELHAEVERLTARAADERLDARVEVQRAAAAERARVVAWLRDLAEIEPRDQYWTGLRDGLLHAADVLERGVGAVRAVAALVTP